jgi:hypothetical protein
MRALMSRPVIVSLAVLALVLVPAVARADEHSIIKNPGDHPSYIFEAEPHILVGFGGPFEDNGNFGVGFRGTIHIANGFVSSINDSVGIGFGLDVGTNGHVLLPVVMQWNFWLSTHWSVFGEPGLAFGSDNGRGTFLWPAFYAGGRLHFTERIALTMRLGYPDFSLGVSFLL